MVKQINNGNLIFGAFVFVGLVVVCYEAYQTHKVSKVNQVIQAGQLVTDDSYDQGNQKDYKHAVQTYGQLLETQPSLKNQAKIQYNIGNNLFVFGLIRRVNDDGTLQDEARYAYTQAKIAYEETLRIDPQDRAAKFNLSLLYSVMANNMKPAPKDQSTMELSNLPVGLP
jgi:mxaK protein